MIYLVSFVIFLLFFACMAIGFIIQGKKLKSENEANAILEGLTCASCTSHCAFAGNASHEPSNACKERAMKIPHKNVA